MIGPDIDFLAPRRHVAGSASTASDRYRARLPDQETFRPVGRAPIPASGATQETTTIRRPHRAPPPTKEGPRVNREIRIPQVQLIDDQGTNHGIVDTFEAMDMAQEAGLDLVEISPNSRPPVAKILDYGRFKYDSQKKAAEARKKQKNTEIKEIKMRPNIDTHDYDVKTRNMHRFFEDGDKVKVTLRFRGREMAHQDLGLKVLNKVRDDFAQEAKVEQMPKLEGRLMVMVMAPLPGKVKPRGADKGGEDADASTEPATADA